LHNLSKIGKLMRKSEYIPFNPEDHKDVSKSESSNSLNEKTNDDKSESSDSSDEEINNDDVEYKYDAYVKFMARQESITTIGSFDDIRSLSCSTSVNSIASISSFNSENTLTNIFPLDQKQS
jgi:hypothetical protein